MCETSAVSSVAEFVTRVLAIQAESIHLRSASVSSIAFYRGQADRDWGLAPRLYRQGLFRQERLLGSELLRLAPTEFSGMDYFETLVKMQHYSLPTRLLDMTLNPLVSLFFACHGEAQMEKDGAVYILPNLPVFRPDNYAIRLIMKYVFEYSDPQLDIKAFVDDIIDSRLVPYPFSTEAVVRDLVLHTISKVPYHAILPKLGNGRIVNQDGAFLLFGMKVRSVKESPNSGTRGRIYYDFDAVGFDNLTEVWHAAKVIRVPHRQKESILTELELLGISWSRLFPELEHQAEHVTKSVARMFAPPKDGMVSARIPTMGADFHSK